jgi:hypothetical protein
MKQVKFNSKAVCSTCFRALDVLEITTYNPKSRKLVRRCEHCKFEEEIKENKK